MNLSDKFEPSHSSLSKYDNTGTSKNSSVLNFNTLNDNQVIHKVNNKN